MSILVQPPLSQNNPIHDSGVSPLQGLVGVSVPGACSRADRSHHPRCWRGDGRRAELLVEGARGATSEHQLLHPATLRSLPRAGSPVSVSPVASRSGVTHGRWAPTDPLAMSCTRGHRQAYFAVNFKRAQSTSDPKFLKSVVCTCLR